jgi:surface protein
MNLTDAFHKGLPEFKIILVLYTMSFFKPSKQESEIKLYTYIPFKPTSKQELISEIKLYTIGRSVHEDINRWDVSAITDMSEIFKGRRHFNGDISKWKVDQVTDMSYMFMGAIAFNRDISGWNVTQVRDMSYMFMHAISFNGNLLWGDRTHNVRNMVSMFDKAIAFNRDISGWNVTQVRDMSYMFDDAIKFNCNISGWNVTQVINMSYMFSGATEFNQNLHNWQVGNVMHHDNMFDETLMPLQNIPALLRDVPLPAPTQAEVLNPAQGQALQVHIAFDTLDKPALLRIISNGELIHTDETDEDFRKHVHDWIVILIDSVPSSSEAGSPDREALRALFNTFADTCLSHLPFKDETKDLIHTAMLYVDKQQQKFKTQYVSLFIHDVTEAYVNATGDHSNSCARGITERLLFSIGSAAASLNDDTSAETNYTDLIRILFPLNIEILQNFASACYEDTNIFVGKTTLEERVEAIAECMRKKLKAAKYINVTDETETVDPDIFKDYIKNKLPFIFGGKRPKRKSKKTKSLKRYRPIKTSSLKHNFKRKSLRT